MSDDLRQRANRLMAKGRREARSGDHLKARACFEEVVELRRQAYGPKSKWVLGALESLAFTLLDLHDAPTSIAVQSEALKISEALFGQWHVRTAASLHKLADGHRFNGETAKAQGLYEQSREILLKNRASDLPALAMSHFGLGANALDSGRLMAAAIELERAVELFRKCNFTDVSRKLAISLELLGRAKREMAQYEDAKAHLRDAISISSDTLGSRHADVAHTMLSLGILFRETGQASDAIAYISTAADIFAEKGDTRNWARAKDNLGNVYSGIGDYARSISIHQDAIQVLTLDDNNSGRDPAQDPSIAVSMGNLAGAYLDLGDYRRAKGIFFDANTIFLAAYDEGNMYSAITLGSIGAASLELDEFEEAEQKLLAARQDFVRNLGEVNFYTANTDLNLANLKQRQSMPEKAIVYANSALIAFEKMYSRSHHKYLESRLCIAESELIGNDLKKSERSLQRLLIETFDNEAVALIHKLYALMMRVQACLGNSQAAIFWGKRAVNLLQVARNSLLPLDEQVQQAFLNSKADVYRHLADLLVEAGRFAEAEQVLAMLKEQELFDLLRRDAEAFGPMTFSMLVGVEVKWNEELEAIGKVLADIISGIEALEKIESRSAEEEAQLTALQAEREVAGARLSTWLESMAASMSETSGRAGAAVSANLERAEQDRAELASLGGQIARLSYILTENRLSIIVTTASLQTAREGEVSEKVINRLVHELRSAMMSATDSVRLRPAAEALWKHLITPVEDILRSQNITTLMIVPYGTLRYLPFAALCGPSGGDQPHYLNDRYAVTVLTLAAGDGHLAPVDPDWTVAGLGVEREIEGWRKLETVRQELSGIVRQDDVGTGIYPGTIRLDEAFDEAGLAAALKEHDAVHVASHFALDTGQALNSKLLLGDGSALTLDRLRSDDFDFGRTELITLSACQTAMGASTEQSGRRQEDGSEFEGFAALVQRRGARSVIASLWAVADASTAPFMIEFYRARSTGLTKAEALRQAQISLRANPQFAHPYHWAPFVLMGNWL